MKSVTLPLASGREITLFIGTQHLLVQQIMNVDMCKVIDGLHNNGGWEINLPYSETVGTDLVNTSKLAYHNKICNRVDFIL